MKRVLFIAILSIFFLSSCQAINSLQPVATAAPGGTVLFSDEFDDNANHWGTSNSATGAVSFVYEGLDIKVDQPNSLLWSVAGKKYADVKIDVDGVLLSGPSNDVFGAVCRFSDANHFYGFLISHDGYYGIFKMENGSLILADQDQGLKYSDVILQGGTVNHITATCQGDKLSLAVNGQLLSIVQDDSYASGQIGLIAGTYENGGSELFFDHLQVSQP
ncbi:MAG: hypothetical protein VB013_11030 [Anaerolineaceae bacterium]|nr:hypothetical protein [Anaerolineaceae bacterium]